MLPRTIKETTIIPRTIGVFVVAWLGFGYFGDDDIINSIMIGTASVLIVELAILIYHEFSLWRNG